MPRGPAAAAMLAAALAATGPAAAYTIVPADDESGRIFVVIERAFGDLVPFRRLPRPWDRAVQTLQGPDALSYRWRYLPGGEEGRGHLSVEADGRARMHFEFFARRPRAGDTLAAAAVLTDAQGRALHALFARAALAKAGAEAVPGRRAAVLEFARPLDWWNRVDAIAFLFMLYPVERGLGDAAIQAAMRRAVGHFTRGEGSEQFE